MSQTRHTGKYRALWSFLAGQQRDRINLTFAEIEQILGFGLPNSSRNL